MTLIGSKLPDMTVEALAPDGQFQRLCLSDYEGQWLVLFFYALDFTFIWPTEIRGFSEKLEEFKRLGASVLGCSTDSVYSHKAWVESSLGPLNFPLIGDTSHQLSRALCVLREEQGVALRATFIVDPSGAIVSAHVNDLNVGRSVEETLRTLQAFQTGQLTPCDWRPGQKTLGPAN